MTAFGRASSCDNVNHLRGNAPVGHCPKCGGVVNAHINAAACNETKHSAARRRQSTFCVDCGSRLIAA